MLQIPAWARGAAGGRVLVYALRGATAQPRLENTVPAIAAARAAAAALT